MLRLTCFLLSAAVCGAAAPITFEKGQPALSKTSFARELQTAKYRANYEARFMHLLEGTCGGPFPLINVLCIGTFELLGTSDSSILCEPLQENVEGFNGYQCRMTCSDRPACRNVWLNEDSLESGPFGEIYFACEGDELADVDATMQYLGSEGNSCNSNILGDGRNFHISQLGVFCPSENDFVYGDYLFECDANDGNGRYTNNYSCLTGFNCEGSKCSGRDIDTVTINADHFRFGDCVQSLDGSPLPEPDEPELIQRPAGTYSARFRADWELDLGVSCSGKFPALLMECTNGEISSPETVYDTTNCEIVSATAINCTESESETFVDNFSGVSFTCTAQNALPTARATYPEYTVTCPGASSPRNNFHQIGMGVYCGDPLAGGFWWYDDYPFECQNTDGYTFVDNRYVCVSFVEHPGGSDNIAIDSTVVFTDFRWSNFEDDKCWDGPADPPAIGPGPSPTSPGEPMPIAPQPMTLAPQPTIIAPQPTIIAPQPTPIAPQPTTIAPQPTPIAPQPTTIAPQPTPIAPQPTTIAPQPTPIAPQPLPIAPQPTTNTSQLTGAALGSFGKSSSSVICKTIVVMALLYL